jgi:hypothetical protein
MDSECRATADVECPGVEDDITICPEHCAPPIVRSKVAVCELQRESNAELLG